MEQGVRIKRGTADTRSAGQSKRKALCHKHKRAGCTYGGARGWVGGRGGQGLRAVFSVKSKRIASFLQRSRANLEHRQILFGAPQIPTYSYTHGPAQWPPVTAPPNSSTCGHAMRGRGQARQVRPKSSPDLSGDPFMTLRAKDLGIITTGGRQMVVNWTYICYIPLEAFIVSYIDANGNNSRPIPKHCSFDPGFVSLQGQISV